MRRVREWIEELRLRRAERQAAAAEREVTRAMLVLQTERRLRLVETARTMGLVGG